MSALGLKALDYARLQLDTGVRGGILPMWGRFRGLRVDEYQRAVGLPVPPNSQLQGFPWCAAAIYWTFQEAAHDLGVPNPCPKTGGALKMWDAAQDMYGTHQPAPGCVFVVDRGGGKGHVGFVELVEPGGLIATLEPDTSNHALSATGDCWGRHVWSPADGARGVLLGYLAF